MKALIAAGGRATRMRPISHTLNKHLIPLANEPMIANALKKVAEVGITEVAININPGETEIQKVVGDGSRWGVHVTYLEQQGGPLGIAHSVKNARDFLGEEPFIFYLGDNIVLGSLQEFVDTFYADKLDCLLALSRVPDPQRFGVPEFRDGVLVRVLEKPANPPSDFAVTGIYLYSSKVFDALEVLQPSARGEYEISDAHTWLIENGARVGTKEITGWWKDTGKHEDLLEGNALLLDENIHGQDSAEAIIQGTVKIQGNVKIGKGSIIGPNVLIRGPVSIGEGCVIADAYIGPYTSIGDETTVHRTEIEHSIVFKNVSLECDARIVDSIIGAHARVTAANKTFPRGHKLILGDNGIVEL